MKINRLFKFAAPVVLAVALVLPAKAYDNKPITVPNITAGSTSNFTSTPFFVGDQKNVALSWTSSSTNTLIRISSSVDNGHFQTNCFVLTFTSATPGTTTVTNLDVGGLGYLKITSGTVTGTINATNIVSFGRKPGI